MTQERAVLMVCTNKDCPGAEHELGGYEWSAEGRRVTGPGLDYDEPVSEKCPECGEPGRTV